MSGRNDVSRWLIAGLGNPGARYVFSRHNVGFMLAETLSARHGIPFDREQLNSRFGAGKLAGCEVLLVQPLTYMNRSGLAVVDLLGQFEGPARIMILYDDLDLPVGRIRVKAGGGSGGHRGVESVIHNLGHTDFIRVRIGIGRETGMPAAEYVLSEFNEDESPLIEGALSRAADAVKVILTDGPSAAMNRFNGPAPAKTEDRAPRPGGRDG